MSFFSVARLGSATALAIVMAAGLHASASIDVKPAVRLELLRRAQVWAPTDVRSMNLAVGPRMKGAFRAGETITCDYVERKLAGGSPKFACAVAPDDDLKVKYGRDNGEVYGEVAATRLLWALGFGADALYPVKVVCRGCPPKLGGIPHGGLEAFLFDPAAVERKMPGHEITSPEHPGWSWSELDLVSDAAGGAPLAHRDGLKLLAAFLQHSDSKPQQQRLVCLDADFDEKSAESCARPFMLMNDVGLTFGKANPLNRNSTGSVNFDQWSRTPVWRDKTGCVANLAGSFTGTLEYPRISEEGRAFLAGLLVRLSDRQLIDLFEAARFHQRPRAPGSSMSASVTVADWRDVFKQKRDEIVSRRCDAPAQTAR